MRVSITRLGPRPQARSLRSWAVFALLTAASCSASTRTETSDFDETGRRADGYKVSATIVGKDKAQLDRARSLAREGDYDGAIAIAESLLQAPDTDVELKPEILLVLGELYGAPLNPDRDLDAATQLLRQLLAEYPDSKQAESARQILEPSKR